MSYGRRLAALAALKATALESATRGTLLEATAGRALLEAAARGPATARSGAEALATKALGAITRRTATTKGAARSATRSALAASKSTLTTGRRATFLRTELTTAFATTVKARTVYVAIKVATLGAIAKARTTTAEATLTTRRKTAFATRSGATFTVAAQTTVS